MGEGNLLDMAAAIRELDICSPGSFFGMTFFGDPRYFKSNARKSFEKEVYEYPLEKFLTAFKEMASLHKNPTCCRRANLPKIFAMAMGRELEDYELDFVLKFGNSSLPAEPNFFSSSSCFTSVWNFRFLKVVKGVASLNHHTILPLIHSTILKISKSTPESSQLCFLQIQPWIDSELRRPQFFSSHVFHEQPV